MKEEIQQLKNKLLVIETKRDELRERMVNTERQIEQNNKMLHLLREKMNFQPPEI